MLPQQAGRRSEEQQSRRSSLSISRGPSLDLPSRSLDLKRAPSLGYSAQAGEVLPNSVSLMGCWYRS